MGLLCLVAVLSVLVPLTLVPWLAGRPTRVLCDSRVAARCRAAVNGLVASLGAVPAAAVAMLAGLAAVVTVCWPLGELLARLEGPVDQPVWRYVRDRRDPGWERVNAGLTLMGERPWLLALSIVAAGVFAILWRRRWWVPVVALAAQFLAEQYAQEVLKLVVNRGHPPSDLGTYPSGGVARVLVTFGVIALLAALTWQIPRRGRAALVTAVTTAACVEGFTRLYLQKHWLTDIVGGLVFGVLLCCSCLLSVYIVAGRIPARPAVAEARR